LDTTEIKAVKTCIPKLEKKEFKNLDAMGTWLALKLDRPKLGTMQKIYQLRREMGLVKPVLVKKNNQQVELQNGFSFEITPVKVVMHPDRRIEMFY